MTQICINVTLFPHDWIQFSVSFFPLGAKSSILPLQGNSRSASLEFGLFQEITQWIHCLNVITWKCMLLYWGIFPHTKSFSSSIPRMASGGRGCLWTIMAARMTSLMPGPLCLPLAGLRWLGFWLLTSFPTLSSLDVTAPLDFSG